MDRSKKKEKAKKIGNKLDELSAATNINVGDLLETISEKKMDFSKITNEEEPITLDDILNLWDGIRETPGRIMIISSNHYYDLDPALIRPGRIDITLELSYASRHIINNMYRHLFDEDIDADKLNNVNDMYYSPAEIINIYMNTNNNKDAFIDRLMQNKHV